jgi:DNA-binding LacI/PurR family transcriptional regulator
LQEAGWRVPEVMSVVGFDDIPLAAYTSPPLTTVRQPVTELARAAATLLLDSIEGIPETTTGGPLPDGTGQMNSSNEVRKVLLTPALIVRRSTTSVRTRADDHVRAKH